MTGDTGTNTAVIALATPLGRSALAVVRASGGDIIAIAAQLFRAAGTQPRELTEARGGSIHVGTIVDPGSGQHVDQVVLLLFRAPHSYTGEDSVEITCHGNPLIIQRIIALFISAGCTEALAGEFTQRAVYNGKLDLTQAEAVLQIIEAESSGAQEQAMQRLEGRVGGEVNGAKAELVALSASINIQLDYPQEESGEITFDRARLEGVHRQLVDLAATYRIGRLYDEGVRVLICGKPNVGKSTLFNRLLGEERAITSEHPGTTRDYLHASVELCGVPVIFYDSAGLRDMPSEGAPQHEIEQEGIRRVIPLAREADVLLYVVDAAVGPDGTDRDTLTGLREHAEHCRKTIVAYNKIDQQPGGEMPNAGAGVFTDNSGAPLEPMPVSARLGTGTTGLVEQLEQAVRQIVAAADSPDGGHTHKLLDAKIVIGSERQHRLLTAAVAALSAAFHSLDTGVPLDMLALDIEEAISCLGEITGEVSKADLLENMFANFCVGK